MVGAPISPSGSCQANIDAIVFIDGEGPPYGTTPGGYVYDVCGPVDAGFEPVPAPGLGFEAVGCPGVVGIDVPPSDGGGLGPAPVGVMLPPDPPEGFEAVPDV
jgi:hypothetical protein